MTEQEPESTYQEAAMRAVGRSIADIFNALVSAGVPEVDALALTMKWIEVTFGGPRQNSTDT